MCDESEELVCHENYRRSIRVNSNSKRGARERANGAESASAVNCLPVESATMNRPFAEIGHTQMERCGRTLDCRYQVRSM